MRPELFVVLSGCLTFCVPLILAVRELIILRKDKNGGGDWRPRPVPDAAPKPLPPCLMVPLGPRGVINLPQRTRELELV